MCPSHALKQNLGGAIDTDVLVCSDDLPAAEEVILLAQAAGMRAYYAGGLDNAVVVEGLTSILISLNKHYGTRTASIQVTGCARTGDTGRNEISTDCTWWIRQLNL